MREVDCLCGERIVFLDDQVQVKTCPNCGMPVYQYAAPSRFGQSIKVKKMRTMPSQGYWMAALLGVVMLAVVVLTALSVARSKAIAGAVAAETRADAAKIREDYYTALEAYEQALVVYKRWGHDSASIAKVEDALREIRFALSRSKTSWSAGSSGGALPISLEELARRAWANKPRLWSEQFDREYAGCWVAIYAKARREPDRAFDAPQLTVSYRLFGSMGEPVEITFDGQFLERYRIKAGSEVVVTLVLREMAFETDSPGGPPRWAIVADSVGSDLITDVDQLKDLGWDENGRIRDLVSRQASLSPAF